MSRDSTTEPIRVVIVDDHVILREGLRALLESQVDIDVVAEAGTVADAHRAITSHRPDVAVIDVQLPDGNGIEVCRDAKDCCPEVRCLILTSHAEDEALFDAVMAGADGYVLKQISGSDLVSCVRRVAAGESLLDERSKRRLRARVRESDDADPLLGHLSAQERKILGHLAEGRTNRDIAAEMFLSEKTVKNYVSKVLMKMGMERRTEAAVYATKADARRHLIDDPQRPVRNPIRY